MGHNDTQHHHRKIPAASMDASSEMPEYIPESITSQHLSSSETWFVASVCSAREADIDIISRALRAFLWNGTGGFRIPLEQLALLSNRGVLNLDLPSTKVKSLSSRYVIQQRSLRVGQHIIRLTTYIISVKSIYVTHIKRPDTKMVIEQPMLNWRKIWYNIDSCQPTVY